MPLLRTAAVLLTVAIFVGDTITNLEIAVPAFYTAVVLLCARFSTKRGVIMVGVGCCFLTLLSDVLTAETATSRVGVINTIISLLAIATTTYLAVKTETERAAAYEARSQLAHVARITTLGELTASIAHEVNQPLAAAVINGNACARWLAADPPNLTEAQKAIDRIVKDANRAGEIIAHVRALTKKSSPAKDLVDINDVIRAIMVLTESEVLQHHISFKTELFDNLPKLRGDPIQLRQVILNLVLNAIEAMEHTRTTERQLLIGSEREGPDAVRVSVQDTGPGIRVEDLDRIFSPFYTTKPDGMGMGLAICRSIIEDHDGRIWAESMVPGGTRLQFVLPTGWQT